jgi:hypothetical protein
LRVLFGPCLIAGTAWIRTYRTTIANHSLASAVDCFKLSRPNHLSETSRTGLRCTIFIGHWHNFISPVSSPHLPSS